MLIFSALACWQAGPRASHAATDSKRANQATPPEAEFDNTFLQNGGQGVDLSRYARGNAIVPGIYSADIYVNGQWLTKEELRFEATPGSPDAQACLPLELLRRADIDMAQLKAGNNLACMQAQDAVDGASASFDFGSLRLNLSIPQVALQRRARGYVPPEQWTEGVPAAMLGYNLNAYQSSTSGRGSSTQGYLGLAGGFNYGRWYVRHNGSLNWSDRGLGSYRNVASYVQRDIADWSSQLIIGDTYTGGDLLDSVAFRGIRLRTDDRMLPESQRGYAPVVRGVANSNARVTVSQSGITLYETTVAPGAFVIDDLYPTGFGGDLDVKITESDGSTRSFAVPYASVPLSLREGHSRYSLTAGAVRYLPSISPFFTQGTWQYGLTNELTGYGGATLAKGYASPMVGAVMNTSWGAFGLDLTHASTRIPGQPSVSGQSLRASYAKTMTDIGTSVAIAAYRYSTSGFYGLNDAMAALNQVDMGRPTTELYRPRNRASVTFSQRLGEQRGALHLTASVARYWNRDGSNVEYAFGYNNAFRNMAYNLSVARQRDMWGRSGTLLYAGLSVPLETVRPSTLMTNASRDSRGQMQAQASLSGLLDDDNRLSYGLTTSHTSSNSDRGAGSQNAASANATYRAPFAELSGSLGVFGSNRQLSASARGAVVAHPGGVTLSQPLSETFAVVEAKHAEGARVSTATDVRIDSRGYAVVPYLTPYAMNEISLDPKGLSTDVELHETRQRVAPLAGAVPMMVFKTSYGRSALLRVRLQDDTPVPFGAVISDMEGKDVGVVGQAGKLLLRGLADQGELQVQWETGAGTMGCSLSYALPERQRAAGYQPPHSLQLPCVASGPVQPARLAQAQAPDSRPAAVAQAASAKVPAANLPPLQRERDLAGLRLSTQLSVLVPAATAASQMGPKAPMAEEQATARPSDKPRDLTIEKTLAALPVDTRISAWMPARI